VLFAYPGARTILVARGRAVTIRVLRHFLLLVSPATLHGGPAAPSGIWAIAACVSGTAGHRTSGPVFDLFASKLCRPLMRPGTVRRLPLIERLARGDLRPIVSVVAPPGYGKTTLLSQWAERNGQSFA
jgi:hypothetical protein